MWIEKQVMFNLYVDLILYSMALKNPDGKLWLKLELYFVLYCIVLYCIVLGRAIGCNL